MAEEVPVPGSAKAVEKTYRLAVGKYAGYYLEEVPLGYLYWIVYEADNMDLSPPMMERVHFLIRGYTPKKWDDHESELIEEPHPRKKQRPKQRGEN